MDGLQDTNEHILWLSGLATVLPPEHVYQDVSGYTVCYGEERTMGGYKV